MRVVDGPLVAGHTCSAKLRNWNCRCLKPAQIARYQRPRAIAVTIRLRDAITVHAGPRLSPRGICRPFGVRRSRQGSRRRTEPASPARPRSRRISPAATSATNTAMCSIAKDQKKFAGNMLERAQLLLNPWAIRSTETGEAAGPRPARYSRRGASAAGANDARRRPASGRLGRRRRPAAISPISISWPIRPRPLLNLVPDKDGRSQARPQETRAACVDSCRRRRSAAPRRRRWAACRKQPAGVARSCACKTASIRRSISRSRNR